MKILGFNFLLGIFENDMANFTAHDHVITHLEVSVDKKPSLGNTNASSLAITRH